MGEIREALELPEAHKKAASSLWPRKLSLLMEKATASSKMWSRAYRQEIQLQRVGSVVPLIRYSGYAPQSHFRQLRSERGSKMLSGEHYSSPFFPLP